MTPNPKRSAITASESRMSCFVLMETHILNSQNYESCSFREIVVSLVVNEGSLSLQLVEEVTFSKAALVTLAKLNLSHCIQCHKSINSSHTNHISRACKHNCNTS